MVILMSYNKQNSPKTKNKEIHIIVKNKPEQESTKQKTKELSKFLSETWHIQINSK